MSSAQTGQNGPGFKRRPEPLLVFARLALITRRRMIGAFLALSLAAILGRLLWAILAFLTGWFSLVVIEWGIDAGLMAIDLLAIRRIAKIAVDLSFQPTQAATKFLIRTAPTSCQTQGEKMCSGTGGL